MIKEQLSVYHPKKGVGVLQFETFLSSNKKADVADLLNFPYSENSTDIQLPHIKGRYRYVEHEGYSYFLWWLFDAERIFYITYVVEIADADIEATEREAILKSFRPVTNT